MNICQGVQLHVLETTKFKDVGFYFRFIQPLRRETATVYSLLALMMSDRLEIYPTKQKMSQRLDELYGMSNRIWAGTGAGAPCQDDSSPFCRR